MDYKTKRPNEIQDALCQLHKGEWYSWIDSTSPKVYANVKLTDKIGVDGVMVNNPVTELPSEATVNAKLKELQDSFDTVNSDVAKARRSAYPSIQDQLDFLYKDMLAGKGDKTGEWFKLINKVKTENPK